MEAFQNQPLNSSRAKSVEGHQSDQSEAGLRRESFESTLKDGHFTDEAAKQLRDLRGSGGQALSERYQLVGAALVFAQNFAHQDCQQQVINALDLVAEALPGLAYMEEAKIGMVRILEQIRISSEVKRERVASLMGEGPALDSCSAQLDAVQRCIHAIEPRTIATAA